MKVSVEEIYTSAACNRIPEIIDWNAQGIICFGACNSVVIYDTNVKGKNPLVVLHHHQSKVNSVKWLRRPDGTSTELVSCSADKTAAIWTSKDGHWKVTGSMAGHKDGITSIHGIYTNKDDLEIYTASIDSTVKVWERIGGITTLKETINLNSGLCLTLHAHLLPVVNKPILFCALDDYKVHVFAGDEYHRLHVLTGHEDWVRGLDVLNVDNNTILLASASQDTYIRLWRIQKHAEEQQGPGIRVEERVFAAHGQRWAVKLEAVLAGHEGWVYGVQWHPPVFDEDTKQQIPIYRLLSSSLDKTLIIWETDSLVPLKGQGDANRGVWVERVRVGEVGGNGLGFYGSRFGPNGDAILGHGYNGSLHIWTLNKDTSQWEPSVVCGGHFGAVEDVRWEPQGRYIMSVSADQTTRVHAPWRTDDGGTEWHEIARPQVHGYDMWSLAVVSASVFASAAEEKVVRVFAAPDNFTDNFRNITGSRLEGGDKGALGASVPSLGLSNKAVFGAEEGRPDSEDDNDGYFVPVNLTAPPTEETLMQNTLWPETHKLYGHGYEVFALDASPDGALVASACKATQQLHAAVLLWETKTWQQIQQLISHTLTVTQLAFSPNSQQLLSVSRDRKWYLYKRREGSNLFDIEAYTDKTNGVHGRIIWCCAWSHDGVMFGTGSRDGKVCLWASSETASNTSLAGYALLGRPLEVTDSSATALAIAPFLPDRCRIIAAGFDTGVIRVYKFDDECGLQKELYWSLLKEMDTSLAHHLTVRRLTFKRRAENEQEVMLASCSADTFVRVYKVAVVL